MNNISPYTLDHNIDGKFLYKYRSLKDLRLFLDILMNRRLYSSLYKELNDPMEGHFCHLKSLDRDILDKIKGRKMKNYMCSLSEKCDNGLMWSMYADSHRGCCIKLKVTSTSWKKRKVQYSEKMVELDDVNTDIYEILSTKSTQWKHEDEVRYIKTISPNQNRPYLKIRIEEIILGTKVDENDRNLYYKLIKSIDDKIKVSVISNKDIDYGYNNI